MSIILGCLGILIVLLLGAFIKEAGREVKRREKYVSHEQWK